MFSIFCWRRSKINNNNNIGSSYSSVVVVVVHRRCRGRRTRNDFSHFLYLVVAVHLTVSLFTFSNSFRKILIFRFWLFGFAEMWVMAITGIVFVRCYCFVYKIFDSHTNTQLTATACEWMSFVMCCVVLCRRRRCFLLYSFINFLFIRWVARDKHKQQIKLNL